MLRNNIIKKAILDLQYNGSRDGFVLQNELTAWANDHLIKTIDEDLQKFDQAGKITRMDNLTIEIQVSEENNWMETISKKVGEHMNYALKNKLLEADSPWIEEVSATKGFFETFIYFLRNGNLPWWSDKISKQEFFAELEKFLVHEPPPEIEKELVKSLRSELVKNRALTQIPDKSFFDMVNILLPEIKQKVKDIWKDVIGIVSGATQKERENLRRVFKKTLLDTIDAPDKQLALETMMTAFIKTAISSGSFALIEKNFERINDGSFKKEVADTILRLYEKPEIQKMNEDQTGINTELLHSKADLIFDNTAEHSEISKESEGIYINNAGLVIVASFLPLLLKNLLLVQDGKIDNISKTVCLVQYLASGNESVAEFELVLTKILCGIDIQLPVETEIHFEENEKKEINEVLLSVIEYWGILKDTSIDGLRESFLMRNGKLWFENNEWHLQVEQRPYDMLLQQLPWNISMIRLPWMKHLLKTNWIH
jgi:hypothetical protein